MKKLLSLSVLLAMFAFIGCTEWRDSEDDNSEQKNTNTTVQETTYTVTFFANDGTNKSYTQTFVSGESQLLNENCFTRTGYDFASWNTKRNGYGTVYPDRARLTATYDIILYAQWTYVGGQDNPDNPVKTYTVTFYSNDGTDKSYTQTFVSGQSQNLNVNCFTRIGYTFAGWNTSSGGYGTSYSDKKAITIYSDKTLYAQWTYIGNEEEPDPNPNPDNPVQTYTVTFYSNDGTDKSYTQTLVSGQSQYLNANCFTRDGYTFAGWATATDGKAVYANGQKVSNLTSENNAIVTLYAVWTDNDKVSPVIFSQPTAVDYGESVTLSCATEGAKISYTIDGVTAEYTDAFPITKDVIITAFATKDGMKDSDTSIASYTVKTYRVTYRSEYGTEPDKIMGLKKGDTLTEEQLAGITAGGYTFSGWYNGENKIEAGYTITCDLELTAKWNANTYTVKFDSNDGSGEMTSQTFTYDVEQALTANTFTRDGYAFAGWATSIDGEKVYTDRAKIKNLTSDMDGEVTLYAVWLISTDTGYTVEHYQQNANDDKYTLAETENQTGTTGTSTVAIAKTYSGFTAKAVEQAKIAADGSTVVKIYYDRNIITLTLNLDGGEGETEITGKYGETVNVTVPTKIGYDFTGWKPELPATFSVGNAIYTATWNVNTYTITYNLDGGTNNTINPTNYTIETETITLIEGKKKGVEFIGWYTDSTFSEENKIFEITKGSVGNIILYAKWRATIVGDIAYSDGSISEDYDSTKTPIGIVIEVSDEGVATKIVSLTQTSAIWSSVSVTTKATSTTDGAANMTAIQNIESWETKYPAFKWCDDYTDASGNSQWYLPAKNELNQLYTVKEYVNAAIDKIIAGSGTATKLGTGYYWSSSQSNSGNVYAWDQSFSDGGRYHYYKSYTYSVRAVRAF